MIDEKKRLWPVEGDAPQVLRPKDPEAALARMKRIAQLPREQQQAAYQAVLLEGRYEVIGKWYDGRVVGPANEDLGPVRPGDTFR